MTSPETATGRQALVVGGGVVGLATATLLTRRGWQVRVLDRGGGCSPHGGGMLAPLCELDHAEPAVARAGLDAPQRWQALLGPSDHLDVQGSLVVARKAAWPLLDELADRIGRAGLDERLTRLDRAGLGEVEPVVQGQFGRGLLVAGEGVVHPRLLLPAMAAELDVEVVEVTGLRPRRVTLPDGALEADVVVDARGLGARDALPLRGVRGEYVVVRTDEVGLSRPVRVAHPRWPIYVVPRPDFRYYVGATMVERDDDGPATVRSTLELLSALYAVHPAFAEADVEEVGVGLRPATADHLPVIVRAPGLVRVNGAFRHGFLLAPRLAAAVADLLDGEPAGEDVAPFVRGIG